MARWYKALVLALASCGRLQFDASAGDAGGPSATGDGRSDGDSASLPLVDPLAPWTGTPTPVSLLALGDRDPSATADLLELYVERAGDIYRMTRTDTSAAWGDPTIVAELSTAAPETTPEISADGLELVFSTNLTGSVDIYRATRPDRQTAWSSPERITELADDLQDTSPSLTPDRLSIVWGTERDTPGDVNLVEAQRATRGSTWGAITRLTTLDTTADEVSPCLASDRLAIYFQSRAGNPDLWVSTRPTIADAFGPPTRITELNTVNFEGDPWVSPDGTVMLFVSNRSAGQMQIYLVTR